MSPSILISPKISRRSLLSVQKGLKHHRKSRTRAVSGTMSGHAHNLQLVRGAPSFGDQGFAWGEGRGGEEKEKGGEGGREGGREREREREREEEEEREIKRMIIIKKKKKKTSQVVLKQIHSMINGLLLQHTSPPRIIIPSNPSKQLLTSTGILSDNGNQIVFLLHQLSNFEVLLGVRGGAVKDEGTEGFAELGREGGGRGRGINKMFIKKGREKEKKERERERKKKKKEKKKRIIKNKNNNNKPYGSSQ